MTTKRGDALNVNIRRAVSNEHKRLTQIAFAAKRFWNYPEAYFDIWKDELTVTPAYIDQNDVFVAVIKGSVVGFCSIVFIKEDFYAGDVLIKKGHWLEHIFIEPAHMKKGIGTALIRHTADYAKRNGILRLLIFSDPNANGFYRKLGASYKGESPSSIAGRTVSLFALRIK